MSSLAVDYRNPNIIRKLGIDILTKELGPVGMAYFLRQYDRGTGDYTAERESLLSGVTMESALSDLEAQRNKENQ
jgi:hypothetical protein